MLGSSSQYQLCDRTTANQNMKQQMQAILRDENASGNNLGKHASAARDTVKSLLTQDLPAQERASTAEGAIPAQEMPQYFPRATPTTPPIVRAIRAQQSKEWGEGPLQLIPHKWVPSHMALFLNSTVSFIDKAQAWHGLHASIVRGHAEAGCYRSRKQ